MALPTWVRYFMPWRLLVWLDKRFDWCWANMVAWKVYGANDPWQVSNMCFDATSSPYDYCGKFQADLWCQKQCLKRLLPSEED